MAAARTAEENRGDNIVMLDMREITPVFDYFVIVTGNSRRQPADKSPPTYVSLL